MALVVLENDRHSKKNKSNEFLRKTTKIIKDVSIDSTKNDRNDIRMTHWSVTYVPT